MNSLTWMSAKRAEAVEAKCNIDKTKEEIMHNEISEEDSSILNYAEEAIKWNLKESNKYSFNYENITS